MNFLSIDVGTTGCKCQLFSEKGEILTYLFFEYDFKEMDGFHYVNLPVIEERLREMIAEVAREHEVSSICVSSLGESFALLDANDEILFYPRIENPRRMHDFYKIHLDMGTMYSKMLGCLCAETLETFYVTKDEWF